MTSTNVIVPVPIPAPTGKAPKPAQPQIPGHGPMWTVPVLAGLSAAGLAGAYRVNGSPTLLGAAIGGGIAAATIGGAYAISKPRDAKGTSPGRLDNKELLQIVSPVVGGVTVVGASVVINRGLRRRDHPYDFPGNRAAVVEAGRSLHRLGWGVLAGAVGSVGAAAAGGVIAGALQSGLEK